jgi:DNA-binding transcriptional ArsR family regulator
MNREESVAAGLRVTIVVLTVLLVFSTGVCALASTGGSPQGVSTVTHQGTAIDYGSCAPPIFSFEYINSPSIPSLDSISTHTERVFEFEDSRVIETAGNIVEDLSDSGSDVVFPIGTVLLRYSRFDDSDPLENDVRQQVYEAVERSPGTYISEVSEECDASRSTVRYHVRILEEEGLIVGEAERGKHRFYPIGSETPELAAALNDSATARVIDAIARLEPVTVSALAEDLDRSPGTVSYHLDRLTDDGLLERERMGNAVVTRLTSGIQAEILSGETTLPAD